MQFNSPKILSSEKGAINLTEVIVAMVLTIIIGYAVFSALFSAGRNLQTQETFINSQSGLRQMMSTIQIKLRQANYPLASTDADGSEIRFTTTSPNSTSDYNCWRYRIVTVGAGKDQLVEETTSPISNPDPNDDPYGVSACQSVSNFSNSRILVENINNAYESTPLRAFTPVDTPCLTPQPDFITTCPVSTNTICPTLDPPASAPNCPIAGIVVAFSILPSLKAGASRDITEFNPIQSYHYVDLPSAR